MAKVKFGALMVDMRGKLGGTVFARNKGGAYSRNKVTPLNPRSTYQAGVRQDMAAIAQAWRGLTAAQRQAWNDAAADFPRTDVFGDTIVLSGSQLHQSLNLNMAAISEAFLTDPPVPGTVEGITSIVLAMAAGAQTATIAFAPSPVPANTEWIVEATAGKSAGRFFFKPFYRQIATIDAAAVTPANIAAAYIAKFGAVPAAGQKVSIRVTPVNKTTGQRGTAITAVAIVAA